MIISQKPTQAGFTLIEVVIAMAIFTALGYLITRFSGDLTDASLRFNRSIFTSQEIEQTLGVLVPELRGAITSNTGSFPIAAAASTSLTFYTDLDRDGITFERVRYFLDGRVFKKGVLKPTGSPLSYSTSSEIVYELIHNMATSTIFSYYSSSATSTDFSTALSSPINVSQIRLIKAVLIADQGSATVPSWVGTEAEATLRNLKYQ